MKPASGMLAAVALLLPGLCMPQVPAPDLPLMQPIASTDSVLVVSPHPDDESLCCGGLIDTARRLGANVAIVWITYGDAFKWDAMVVERTLRPRPGTYLELAEQRGTEARAAASILEVPSKTQFFLGYPDRGVLSLLFDHYFPTTPWRSKFTGENAVVYEDAVRPGATYDGEDLVEDFSSVVDRVKPTLVLAPSPQDTHPDHRAAGLLALRVMMERGQPERVRFWVVHGGRGWPTPRAFRPDLPQTIAPRGRGMQWERFPLDAAAIDSKHRAIEAHRSQTRVMHHVMLSHIRSLELYSLTPVPAHTDLCLRPEPCEFEDQPLMEESGL